MDAGRREYCTEHMVIFLVSPILMKIGDVSMI